MTRHKKDIAAKTIMFVLTVPVHFINAVLRFPMARVLWELFVKMIFHPPNVLYRIAVNNTRVALVLHPKYAKQDLVLHRHVVAAHLMVCVQPIRFVVTPHYKRQTAVP